MSSSGQKTFNVGYRSWFQPFRYNQRVNLPIFVLDYETASFWEEQYDDYLDHENKGIQANTQLVNGIQVYFLDENLQKRKAFLRHEPYFYLLLEEGLSKHEKNRISNTIREIGESQVRHVEEGEYYDAANLTFLEKKSFMKVTVDRPGSVPNLRTKSEEINGVIEWREADVLFHHRTAIDHNVRVGSWYTADIAGGKIQTLTNIPNRAPPALRVLAFDIETVFEQTRDPTPNRDSISVISLFTGGNDSNGNILIVNSHVVETKDLQDFNILLKASDKDHSKPWVDWNTEKELQFDSEVIEKFPIKIIVTKNEKELLDYFYQFIREYQPDVITDFFGGRFDIPFLAVRSEKYGISFEKETGFQIVLKYRLRGKRGDLTDLKRNYSPNNFDYVAGAGIIHLDAYLFNEKYSYLPKKDLGLKPSVERKLKIIPIGREALFAIKDNPVEAIAYAASDGYITWKYVKEIVLDFFISMGQMFPVPASELLTRRSGSLDDLLIDAEDYQHQVIGKKRIGQTNIPSFSSGIVIESLAYTGGLVEARRPGLFRSDIYFDYEPNKMALESLKEIIRRAIKKESKNLVKSIEKEEFERLIGSELEDVRFEYSEDPILFLSQLETDLLKNGISAEEISKQLESIRKILEKTSTLHVVNVEQAISETCEQLDQLIALEGKTQLRGVHVDVTSMYPSQIRQYKLQPSGIVPLTMCRTCELREADDSCFFEGDWVIKLTARRPCRFKVEGSGKCDPNICTAEDETKCKKYDPSPHERSRSQEIFTFNQKKTEAYLLIDNSRLEQVPIGRTYLGSNTSEDPFVCLQRWLLNSVEATQLTTNLDQNQFDIFEDQPKELKLPSDTFMSLDVRTKKITVLLSVNSRVCQKAYNFVSRIMDDFFNTRVKHKIEAQRLKQVISQKLALNQPVNPDLQRQQKFHDSTQLGMKVPLNSIFPDEPIVIIDDEGIRPIQIGFFVNKYVNDGESSKNITENTKTFTFDDEGKISLKRITHVFKHKTDHKSFSIITKNGRKVKITEDHSIFILDNEQNIILARGDEIKKGDRIVIPKFFPKAFSPFSNDQVNLMKLIDPEILDSNDINLIVKVRNGYFISKQWKTEKRILSCVNNGNQGVPIAKLKKLFKEPRTAIRNLNRLIEYGILTVDNDRYASNGYSHQYEELLEILINKTKRNYHTRSYDIPLIDISRLVKELPDHIFTNWELGYYSDSYQTPLVSLKKLAQYLGFFVSEGYRRIQKESFDVNICNSDKKIIKNMIKCASIFGEPRISKMKNSNVVYIRSGNAIAYSILESIGVGVDSKTKRIPPIIFNSPDEVKLEFLKALIAGDGTIDENGKFIKYSSISKSLVYCDLPLLLLMLDIYRFTIKEDQSNNNTIYRIKILQSIANFVDFDYNKRTTSLDLVPNEWIPIKYSKRMSTSLFREKGLYSKVIESDIWFDFIESVEEISTPEFVYDISVKDTERFFAGHAFLGIHNSIYGLLGMKGGVRNASMPCAGITTKLSADLIHWAANQLEQIGLVTELDSLDYNERLIFRDPDGLLEVSSIGEYFDECLSRNGIDSTDDLRSVDYVNVPKDWAVLSVSETGIVEWKPIIKCIRQKSSKDVYKVTTPFGSIVTTDSHSIFHSNGNLIKPIEVKSLNEEFITHIERFPSIKKENLYINFTDSSITDLDLYVFIPEDKNVKWTKYPISTLRYDKNNKNKRKKYYRVPLKEFEGDLSVEAIVGTLKSYKYPAKIPLDENIAELCGWYVAEGSSGLYEDRISVGISQQKNDNLTRIEELIKILSTNILSSFKITPSISDSKTNTFRLAMDNVFFYHLFAVLGCGKNAFEKRIPKLILNSSLSIKRSFLTGYFKGDGSKTGKRMLFWTSSNGLRDDLFVLGKELGYVVSIQETVSTTSGNIVYMINFMDIENWKARSKSHYENKQLNETIGLKKKAIIQTKKTSEYVYDLSVLDNNNFVSATGGIVCHNTDGVWLWIPKLFPLEIPITVKFPYKDSSSQVFQISLIDKILNEKVISTGFRNDNYWINDGKKIARSSKSLIKFEQDGPYDFQFVMGKKKYIVYNYDEKKNEWIEEELTGLESKRADFSQLQKYFQEQIINSYLQQYDPVNPIPLDQLYQNAIETATQIRTEMIDGHLDPSYFVKPKAINKPLKSYKSKLPQVYAAYILKDLGFSVDPGTRIQMLNIKGNHVIPRQIFDFDFNKIKEVLVKHAICTLSFMLGELSTKEDLRKLIDVRQYQEDIFGPGRIYDRMIRYPMEIQKIKATSQQVLDINDIEDLSTKRKMGVSIAEQEQGASDKKSPIKKTKMIKRKKKVISRRSRGKVSIESKKSQRQKTKTRGLDDHFKVKRTEKVPLPEKSARAKAEKKIGRDERFIKSNLNEIKLTASVDPSLVTNKEEPIKLTSLVSEEELDELETSELFTNGLTNNQAEYISEQESLEENIVCSECGALVNPQEMTSEGCVFCGGRKISQ